MASLESRTNPMKYPTRFTLDVSPFDRLRAGCFTFYVLLWAAWAIRLWQLDLSDLTFDEAATYFVAQRPFFDILGYLSGAVREHPPVFYLLIHPWMSLAGSSEYSLRFFAVLASILGIALTIRLARTVAHRMGVTDPFRQTAAATLPALVMVLFPLDAYYARDARMYTLTVVWAVLSALLFLPLLFDRGARPRLTRLSGLVLVNGLALLTHYYLALFIVTQFVTLLFLRRWRTLLAWVAAHGLVGLLGLVWLAASPGLSGSLSEAWGRFRPAWPTLRQLRRLLTELFFGPIKGVSWNLTYLWSGLAALGLFVIWRRSRILGLWLTMAALLPLALVYVLPQTPSVRYLTFLLPFIALALGQIPFLLTGRLKTLLLGGGLAALMVWQLGVFGLPRTLTWVKSRYGHTVAAVSAHARPGDRVLFYGPWQAIQFYYYRPTDFPPITTLPPQAPPQLTPVEAEPVLRDLFQNAQRLWVIPAAVDDVDPAHFVWNWLDTHAHQVWSTDDFGLYLPPSPTTVAIPLGLTFGDRLRLEHVSADAPTVAAGEALRLTLSWATLDAPTNAVQLDFTLIDAQNHRWLQWQRDVGDPSTDRHGLIVPQGAPPGRYALQLAVLDRVTGVPLRPADAAGPRSLDRVDLLVFDVTEPVAPPVLFETGAFAGPFTFSAPDGAAQLTLAGYDLGGLRFQQGYAAPLQLNWVAPASPLPDLTLRLEGPHAVAAVALPLAPGYPASRWSAGRLVSMPMALPLPPDAPSGRTDLTLAVLGPDGRTWTVDGRPYLTLAHITVQARPRQTHLPAGLEPLEINFGDQIGLRGYRIKGEARPGGQLRIALAWTALRSPERVYSAFNHLLAADGHKLAQTDHWLQGSLGLTDRWQPGEYVQTEFRLDIPADAPPGPYQLAVGLYDAATGDRLPALYDGQPLPNDQWLTTIAPKER